MESCRMFLQLWLTWLMVFELKKGKLLDDNFEDTRPLGLNVESTI